MELKRILRTKVTLAFGSSLVLPAGDYEGDNIPEQLEAEFELGSPHVEEVVTRVPGEPGSNVKKTPAQRAAEARLKRKIEAEKATEAEKAAIAAGLEDQQE